MKDADATAIYGSQGANGVILITTKKGRIGKTRLEANVQSGFSSPARTMKLLNTEQYLAMRHEAFRNDGVTPGPADHDVNGDWDSTRYTDWQKVLARNTAHWTNAQLSLSGGNANTQFLLSATYGKQTTSYPTLIPNDGAAQNAAVHFNINHVSDNQKLRLVFGGSYSNDVNRCRQQIFQI